MPQTPSPLRVAPPGERAVAKAGEAGAPHDLPQAIRGKTIVLIGLMGVGKTTVGRGLAAALNRPFCDADEEVERAACRTVAEIFAERGEAEFRNGERRVIARLLAQESPHVLAFGGGAFTSAETRDLVRRRAVAVWLKGDLEILARRVSRKATRPLLVGKDPLEVLKAQAEARYPVYAEAQLTVETGEAGSAQAVAAVIAALDAYGCEGE